MKKKILTILMFVVILFSMTGCGGVKIRQIETKSLKYVEYNNGLVKLKVNDIMYFEYSERKINLYTNNDSIYQFYDTIYKLEERFKQYHFISPHKAFLVNIDYIQNIHLNDLILEKDIIIPISKLKKKQIKDAYLNAISKEMDQ